MGDTDAAGFGKRLLTLDHIDALRLIVACRGRSSGSFQNQIDFSCSTLRLSKYLSE
jgi:hypothetical protein